MKTRNVFFGVQLRTAGFFFFTLVALALQAPNSRAQIVLTPFDNSSVEIDPVNGGVSNWIINGYNLLNPSTSGLQWFYYSVGSNAPAGIQNVGAMATPSVAIIGDIVELHCSYGNGSSPFSLQIVYTLAGSGIGTTDGDLHEEIGVRNNGASPLSLKLFQFASFTVPNGTVSLQTTLSGGTPFYFLAQVTGGPISLSEFVDGTLSPGAQEGTISPSLAAMTSTPGFGLPGPAANASGPGGAWALEWNPTIPVNGVFWINYDINASGVAPVPEVTWANPSPIIYGTALSSVQLNATAIVPGSFAYSPGFGAVLNVGTDALSVVFTPTDIADYITVTDTVTLVVNPAAPSILNQPPNQAVVSGGTASFSVVAGGAGPLTYQWLMNGTGFPDATNATLSLTNARFTNAGGYSVIVTNAYGSVTSVVAQLTVFTNLVVTQTNKSPPTPGNPTIPTDATQFKVFTNGGFVTGIGLDPTKSTVVLTHGWNDSSSGWPLELANNIKLVLGASTPNIVAWDWTMVAAEPLPAATLNTQGQGYAMGEDLAAALGPNYSRRIHFIGHSLGTLVNAKAANYIHTNGYSWTNTQMTLFDDAEVAWGLVGNSWATLTSLLQNDSSPLQDWIQPLPTNCAWADNYITAVGMPHQLAVNVILTNLAPDLSNIQNLFDFFIGAWTGQFKTEFTDYHDYPYIWYLNTVNQINNPNDPPYLMGFVRSPEGGGSAGRPSTNTYYIESPNCPPSFPSYSGYDPAYNLVQITSDQANQYLNARPQNLISQVGVNLVSTSANILANNNNQQVQLLNGPIVSASSQITGPAYAAATLFQLFTTSTINGSPPSGLLRPQGGPVPLDGSSGNSPAYIWIPVTVPSNALTMAFNFMLQGNGNQDFFQVAMNSNNLMTVETVLIPTNVTMCSGMIDVSQYAGLQAELFFGIVGGTSTNASLTVSDIAFYVTLPPSLQIQMAGTNVVLTWPLSANGFVLQSANQLTQPTSWTTVTNVPVIVDFQYTVTNQISSGNRFYRLARVTAPTLQAQVSGSNFIVSWPTSATGYVLETSTNLVYANSWTGVTNIPAAINGQYIITNGISDRMRFYRLEAQ